MERPTGVTILAVLNFFGAGLLGLAALFFFVGGAALSQMSTGAAGGPGSPAFLAGMGAFVGVILLGCAALWVTVGVGLWKLLNWGRVLYIVLMCLGVLGATYGLLGALAHFQAGAMIGRALSVALNVWILWYLFRPHVKQAFGA